MRSLSQDKSAVIGRVMGLRSLLLIGCCLSVLQGAAIATSLRLQKRAISSYTNIANGNKHDDVVEGSGEPPVGSKPKTGVADASADIEWEGSAVSPDDEDGDVVEGSGAAPADEVHGSGHVPITGMPPLYTTNTTAREMARPPLDVNIHDMDRRPEEEDVAIEEEVVTTRSSSTESWTTPVLRPRERPTVTDTAPVTPAAPPPTIYDDKQNIPFDASLLKPGVLAAVIGGVVIGILAAILLVMFVVYRMRKKDEGSYALDEPKQPPHYSYAYQKAPAKEFYA